MGKDKLKKALQEVLEKLGVLEANLFISFPDSFYHGDLTTNIAMVSYPKVKDKYKSPREFSLQIVETLLSEKNFKSIFSNISVEGPGFINFTFSNDYLTQSLSKIKATGQDALGQSDNLKDKTIIVEFTDPNPFKEFHIGHLYSNSVGESICRLLEARGANVIRANYEGDVGLHVAKAIWGMKKIFQDKREDLLLWETKPLEVRIQNLGFAYVTGVKMYEESEEAKNEINQLNKKIYEKDESIKDLYEKGRAWSLAYFEEIYRRLGTTFAKYYFESEVGPVGLKFVQQYLEKGIFEKSEGAVIFPGKKFGLHNRVFINSLGLPTYEAKELGLAVIKYEDVSYDESVIITGNEINEYFKVLLKALGEIRPDLVEKTKHISHGMVRLTGGKMSSRTGNVLTGVWLLDEAKKKALSLGIEKSITGPEKDSISETVAVGAVKYSFLRHTIGSDIVFSFDDSVSLDGNSGPYLQYAYARTQSVLKKAEEATFDIQNFKGDLNQEERNLISYLLRFPNIIEQAAGEMAPNVVCNYLFELAQGFNVFYQKHSILEGGESRSLRLAMTDAVGKTIKKGLYLLGIEVSERM